MLSDPSPITIKHPPKFETADVLGIKVAKLTVDHLHQWIEFYIQNNQKELILHTNVHGMNQCFQYPWLYQQLNDAAIVFCDGAGIMLSAMLLGDSLPQRITYADWMWQLGEFAQEKQFSFYFLGGDPGVAKKAAARLQATYPNLNIAGVHHGYIPVENDAPETQAVIADINAVSPDILLVGMGMPRQERWLLNNWRYINAHVALTGGAVFDYISGDLQRAPTWMTNYGFEWMGRLLIEPRRLWKRYVIGNPRYFWRVFLYTLGRTQRQHQTSLNSTPSSNSH